MPKVLDAAGGGSTSRKPLNAGSSASWIRARRLVRMP
jgi:hypothetical protein